MQLLVAPLQSVMFIYFKKLFPQKVFIYKQNGLNYYCENKFCILNENLNIRFV